MAQIKRMQGSEQMRYNSSAPKSQRHKQGKLKVNLMKGREVFLTDNQTDQTKSSNEAKQNLEQEVRRLQRENSELRECILKMKASEYYGINEEKVKKLIRQNQNFKSEMRVLRNQLQKTMMEKDFLQRNNRVLKQRYEQFTKQNSRLVINSRLKTQQSRIREHDLMQDIENFLKQNKNGSKSKRSTSGERGKMLKRKVFTNLTNKPEQKSNPQSKKQKEQMHIPHFNQEYYLIRNVRSYPKKSYP